ncbi:UNVERIFIED_CONTAM: hypothetical protein Sangu_2148600 [Sesamum angustifolium]|uniref:Uncharacterized protein n=1 Tax=Sesamum angustifolium TaxID=2727405 RepID=A0AAW2LEG7_9LAMI
MAKKRNQGVVQASDDNNSGYTLQGGIDAFHRQALVSHFEKLLDHNLEGFHEILDQGPSDGEEYDDIRAMRVNRPRDRPRQPREEDGGLGGVEVTIPSFKGNSDLEAYLECSKIVDEYYKDMEISMVRTNIIKDNEETMTYFLDGLNRDIVVVVERHHYVELEEMTPIHQA